MASKTTKNNETLELSKTIKVDDKEYNINAVRSDVASQVDAPLLIKKYVNAGDPDITAFVGNQSAVIDFVPASGGHYTGPIETPTHTSEKPITEQSVLNKAEITAIVSNLTGASWFTWGRNDQGQLKFTAAVDANEAYQSICIVVGNDSDVEDFNTANFSGSLGSAINQVPSYLYIGINGSNANMYFGTSAGSSPILLTNKLFGANGEIITADSINKISNNLDNTTGSVNDLETLTNELGAKITDVLEPCLQELQNNDDSHENRLVDLEKFTDDVKSGDIVVGSAAKDANGDSISQNYYRTANQAFIDDELPSGIRQGIVNTSDKTNTILISDGKIISPTTAGNQIGEVGEVGDIWIVYTN